MQYCIVNRCSKMMIPVYLKHLIIMIPLAINGVIGGVIAYSIGIKGHRFQDLVIQD